MHKQRSDGQLLVRVAAEDLRDNLVQGPHFTV
jgi:hypothetical protein